MTDRNDDVPDIFDDEEEEPISSTRLLVPLTIIAVALLAVALFMVFTSGCASYEYTTVDPETGITRTLRVDKSFAETSIGELEASRTEFVDGRVNEKMKVTSYETSIDAALGAVNKALDKVPSTP